MAYSARVDGRVGATLAIEPTDWNAFANNLRTFAPKLYTELRRELRQAGEFGVDDVKKTLEMPSPDGGPDDHRWRDMLAAATKVSLSFSPRTAGVSISTNSNQIPEAHRAIMRAYNKGAFRHPVFGDTDQWVQQRGRPYFGQVFEQMVFRLALDNVNRALGNATAALERYRSGS